LLVRLWSLIAQQPWSIVSGPIPDPVPITALMSYAPAVDFGAGAVCTVVLQSSIG
jgi:hypothetical protein